MKIQEHKGIKMDLFARIAKTILLFDMVLQQSI